MLVSRVFCMNGNKYIPDPRELGVPGQTFCHQYGNESLSFLSFFRKPENLSRISNLNYKDEKKLKKKNLPNCAISKGWRLAFSGVRRMFSTALTVCSSRKRAKIDRYSWVFLSTLTRRRKKLVKSFLFIFFNKKESVVRHILVRV